MNKGYILVINFGELSGRYEIDKAKGISQELTRVVNENKLELNEHDVIAFEN